LSRSQFFKGPNRLAYAFYMKTCLDLGYAVIHWHFIPMVADNSAISFQGHS
jgi:hypothetical protein